MKGRIVCGIAIALFLGMLIIGCGDEAIAPMASDPTESSLILIVSRDDSGQVSVKSSDGRIYGSEFLQKVLDGQVSVREIKVVVPSQDLVQAGPPRYPASDYITDVTPVRDGVNITLTVLGLEVGNFWNGAQALAYWTIDEYERQSGKKWPYNKRSKDSVATEIMVHCWTAFTPFWPRIFPINIGFNEWYW